MTIKKNTTTIGVDIGGTNMKAVLLGDGKVLAGYELATPKDSLDHFLVMLKALIEPLLDTSKKNKSKLLGIGLGLPGIIDNSKKEILEASPNLTLLQNVKIGSLLESKLSLPVRTDNDANCFLRAEVKLGVAQKYQNVYGITIGTGIGGAWWFNNGIYNGAFCGGGEVGRMIIDFNNSFELEKAYQKIMRNNPGRLAKEAYEGDVLAEKSFSEFGSYLGLTLANIVNLLEPEAIVLGGQVVNSSDLFLPATKKYLLKYIMNPQAQKIKIFSGNLGKDAGAIGAALLFE